MDQELQKQLFESIKSKNISSLNSILMNSQQKENRPFWLDRFAAIVQEIQQNSEVDTSNSTSPKEQFWLDIMRAFIDVIPR